MASAFPVEMTMYIGLVLIGLWVVYRVYLSFAMSPEGFASGGSGSGNYKFAMYYADWCGHCTRTKPTFMKLGSTQTIGGKTVEIAMINAEKNPDLVGEQKIAGYPTIRLFDPAGSLVSEYNGDRSLGDLQSFLSQNVK